MKMEKIEKGLAGIVMPGLVLVIGLALAFSMISFLNFGLWTQILGWTMSALGAIGLAMSLPKVMGMFK